MGVSLYAIGVCVALVGHSISALGINLQKYAHMQTTDKSVMKKPSWIIGLICMGLCEVVNFGALALAPASVVAPLGSFSVVCSAIFARFFFGESIDIKSIIGIAVIVVGTTLVVVMGPSTNEDLSVEKFKQIMKATKSLIYIGCNVFILIATFCFGNNSIIGTLGLAAISAGNTITLTKVLSMFVAMTIKGDNQLKNWIPYIVLLLIGVCVVVQIQKLNRAMEKYPSYICCALQFVILTIVTIVNSAVLFDEMISLDALHISLFCVGCVVVMVGVYLLSVNAKSNQMKEDQESLVTKPLISEAPYAENLEPQPIV